MSTAKTSTPQNKSPPPATLPATVPATAPRVRKRKSDELPDAFVNFDRLPDSAMVDITVVALLDDCSVATAWRRVASGDLPEGEHIGGMTRWSVGTLRAARAVRADTANATDQERATRLKQLHASKAHAGKRTLAKTKE